MVGTAEVGAAGSMARASLPTASERATRQVLNHMGSDAAFPGHREAGEVLMVPSSCHWSRSHVPVLGPPTPS